MNCNFSVVIPLYNKRTEIARALRSVLSQTCPPLEIVVVDDGSTDGSAEEVETVMTACEGAADKSGTPPIKLIRQANAGETAARNRGMAEASGDHFALIDADDEWRPEFLAEIAALIEELPGAGLYCTGFDIVNTDGEHPARTPGARGVIRDYFGQAMTRFIATASSSVLPRVIVEKTGGFPEGMRIGGDLYMWIKIAREYPVAFSPERLVRVHATAANRSAAIYKPETTAFSFSDFYDTDDPALNEYIARAALGKAIVISVKGGTKEGLSAEQFFAYNRRSRRLWWRLWVLNRLPRRWRPGLHNLYTALAWRLAKKGL